MNIPDQLRDDLLALIACAENTAPYRNSDAADRVREWLYAADGEIEPFDADATLSDRRDLNGNTLSVAEVREFVKQGYRTYSVDCAYDISHTQYFCHNDSCPED